MKIVGKRNRLVPVLLTPDMQSALRCMLEARQRFITDTNNNHLFAVSNAKRSTTGWVALRNVVKMVKGLQCPESLTSTKMRKYLATMSKV